MPYSLSAYLQHIVSALGVFPQNHPRDDLPEKHVGFAYHHKSIDHIIILQVEYDISVHLLIFGVIINGISILI